MIKLTACTKSVMNRTPLDYIIEQVVSGVLPPLLINDGQITGVEDSILVIGQEVFEKDFDMF